MNKIEQAARLINNGEVVIFPTETVYGLGADATSDSACRKIYQIKNRPGHNPLIVHCDSIESIAKIANISKIDPKLIDLWPGPLTLVVPLLPNSPICQTVTAGLSTVACRIPSNPIAQQLLQSCQKPIAAPSANISGRLSSTCDAQVKDYFANKIFLIENDDHCSIGLESTILDVTTTEPVILRHGFYTREFLHKHLQKDIAVANKDSKVIAPGMLLKHYAPKTKIRLNAQQLRPMELGLAFGQVLDEVSQFNLSKQSKLEEAAQNLYRYLFILDQKAQELGYNSIAIAPIPQHDLGIAINDRLSKASE